MQRADPDPPVVVVNGDLLAHDIMHVDSTPTAVAIARRLDRAFPRAQFVLALGNNDSACGDYALAPGAKFLHAVAAAWGPLINRRGAAPDFMRTFVRDGFYTATLPVAGLRITNWPIEPFSTAEVGTIVALWTTSTSNRVLTN